MSRTLAIFAAAATFAAPAIAQTTTAEVVGGPSGNAAYPIEVIGANGVQYFCRPNGVASNGASVYACIRPGAASAGLALGNGAVAGAGIAVAIVALAIAADNETTSTED